MDNKVHLAHLMRTVLMYAPEATAREESDGNILISLNMHLVDDTYLVPFKDEFDLKEEAD